MLDTLKTIYNGMLIAVGFNIVSVVIGIFK